MARVRLRQYRRVPRDRSSSSSNSSRVCSSLLTILCSPKLRALPPRATMGVQPRSMCTFNSSMQRRALKSQRPRAKVLAVQHPRRRAFPGARVGGASQDPATRDRPPRSQGRCLLSQHSNRNTPLPHPRYPRPLPRLQWSPISRTRKQIRRFVLRRTWELRASTIRAPSFRGGRRVMSLLKMPQTRHRTITTSWLQVIRPRETKEGGHSFCTAITQRWKPLSMT